MLCSVPDRTLSSINGRMMMVPYYGIRREPFTTNKYVNSPVQNENY